MAEKSELNTKFLTDEGLDENTARKLVEYGVTQFKHLALIKFENEGFKKLGLNELQEDKVKELKQKAERLEGPDVIVDGCRMEVKTVSGSSSAGFFKSVGAPPQRTAVTNTTMTADVVQGNSNFLAVMQDSAKSRESPEYKKEIEELIRTLTDSPWDDLDVEWCTGDFYEKEKEGAYPMSKAKRGRALIINVQKDRKGTDVDRDKLEILFRKLHFEPVVYNDDQGLTAEGIKEKVKKFADFSWGSSEACVVCILAHGVNGFVLGTDGEKISLEKDVFDQFNSSNCKSLEDKPKIFLIQACRGGADKPDDWKPCGGRSHMVIFYPTQKGYPAFRNEKTGSRMVEAVAKVFARFAATEDVLHLFTKVTDCLQEKLKDKLKDSISSVLEASLGKKLFFFPGIQK